MRQLILGTMTAALVTLGSSAAAFAAPFAHQFDRSISDSHATSVQRVEYYYQNHHRYAHRDWDQTIAGGTTTTNLAQRLHMVACRLGDCAGR